MKKIPSLSGSEDALQTGLSHEENKLRLGL